MSWAVPELQIKQQPWSQKAAQVNGFLTEDFPSEPEYLMAGPQVSLWVDQNKGLSEGSKSPIAEIT